MRCVSLSNYFLSYPPHQNPSLSWKPSETHLSSHQALKNARLSQGDVPVLIDLLKNHQSQGHHSDAGWKGIVWTARETDLRNSEPHSGGGPKTVKGCGEISMFMAGGSFSKLG